MTRKLISQDDLPIKTRAKCPICGAAVIVEEIDEWETETGRVTDCGFHINCETGPDIDSDEWDDWHRWHWSMPYVDWLPLEVRLLEEFNQKFRYVG